MYPRTFRNSLISTVSPFCKGQAVKKLHMKEALELRRNAYIFDQRGQEKNPKPFHVKSPEAAKASLQMSKHQCFGDQASPGFESDSAALPAMAAERDPESGADGRRANAGAFPDHPAEEDSDVGYQFPEPGLISLLKEEAPQATAEDSIAAEWRRIDSQEGSAPGASSGPIHGATPQATFTEESVAVPHWKEAL
ncbi:hypothetical protein STEG23_029217 [Scotinomys teguina]